MQRCVCNPGFEYSGTTCQNMNECLNPTLCPSMLANSICVDTDGSFECPCAPGFFMNLGECMDRDECSSELSPCDPLATCQNIFGSFLCHCATGYSGSGRPGQCNDINECSTSAPALTHNCDRNAICRNSAGSFLCQCNSGFTGDGQVCSDINECGLSDTDLDLMSLDDSFIPGRTDNCGSNSTCMNTIGSFQCQCVAGFSGDGVTCMDIDECANSALFNCHLFSACNNTLGSFRCDCIPGFFGNATFCQSKKLYMLGDNLRGHVLCTMCYVPCAMYHVLCTGKHLGLHCRDVTSL